MLYLDVTSAATSPVNMGVQRTVRALHQHLRAQRELTPVRWDFRAQRYARLFPREQNFLDHPFAAYGRASSVPGRWDWRHAWESWRDDGRRGARGVRDDELLAAGNILLIPDLCWDARIKSWTRWEGFAGRRLAVFHDAMPLRIPGQADSHDALFADYVRALARLDLVLCISQEVEDDLRRFWKEFGVAPRPTRVLTWPVPFSDARPDNGPNLGTRRVIYVARLKLRKNHLVLLEACEKLWRAGETFALDFIGVEDAFTDTLKIMRRVRALARAGRPVRWRKHISDAELAEAYRDCSFTAFPSRMEGFGLPIIESLWHRRPVICGRNGAIGEVAAGGGCFQIDQNNVEELANALQRLLNDEPLYQRLYDEAGGRVFRSWDDYLRELLPLLAPEPSPVP